MFELKNLKFKDILDIPSLVLDRPVVCLMGPSGSGKTTLLRHLNRLNEPDEGTILYNGQTLSAMDPVTLRRSVVMLGQTPVIYDGTVADNLQVGLRFSERIPASRTAMEAALERVGLAQPLDGFCDKLSGGEKQRLCLARVMLMEAETYLMDEPSAALDRETEHFMIGNLAAFARERGSQLILVSHSPQVAGMFPDGIITLEKGRVKEVAV